MKKNAGAGTSPILDKDEGCLNAGAGGQCFGSGLDLDQNVRYWNKVPSPVPDNWYVKMPMPAASVSDPDSIGHWIRIRSCKSGSFLGVLFLKSQIHKFVIIYPLIVYYKSANFSKVGRKGKPSLSLSEKRTEKVAF
jgi:hypothetical protein